MELAEIPLDQMLVGKANKDWIEELEMPQK